MPQMPPSPLPARRPRCHPLPHRASIRHPAQQNRRAGEYSQPCGDLLSERGDSNARPLRPERSALPTALLSDKTQCKDRATSPKRKKKAIKNEKKFVGIKIMHTFASAFNHGAIAQLVEQRTENPCVPGSIPGGTTLRRSTRPPFFMLHNISSFLFHTEKTPYLSQQNLRKTNPSTKRKNTKTYSEHLAAAIIHSRCNVLRKTPARLNIIR